VVFGCADSRVAAEIIFDQGLGDMFVVRTAGHVIDAAVPGIHRIRGHRAERAADRRAGS
jgi:carbonic anhydrase